VSGGPEFAQAMDLLVAKYPQYRTLGFEREAGTVIRVHAQALAGLALMPERRRRPRPHAGRRRPGARLPRRGLDKRTVSWQDVERLVGRLLRALPRDYDNILGITGAAWFRLASSASAPTSATSSAPPSCSMTVRSRPCPRPCSCSSPRTARSKAGASWWWTASAGPCAFLTSGAAAAHHRPAAA
jgi:hypothetical protein